MPMNANQIDASAKSQAQRVETYGRAREHKVDGFAGPKDPGSQLVPISLSDHADISDKARELADLRRAVEAGRDALAGESAVRADRLALVRERLTAGYYQSAAVRDEVAGRLSTLFFEGPLF
ncbi:MAG TPA: hypothetical protein PLL30_07700 [Candidatus Krumholzibacteria bacterium]|nr:hypothetical protein [Candidatus Krumholzibacteria bacterium]HPD71640.1 hypothetical protein [Candidatus Krumholzibacteria bacterium]HRY41427.1 hypothetical protein [Candidatus Krumholzibacteria bacterium]